jgi:large subunit ribosomal protein L9
MEVILKKSVENLGDKDAIVTVKPGYARNYLIPQGLAVTANETNRKILANSLKFKSKREEALLAEYKEIAAKLQKANLKVGAKVGSTDKIFGSVTTHHLAEAIKAQLGIEVDRRALTIQGEEIKNLGAYKLDIKLHDQIQVTLDFEVVAE